MVNTRPFATDTLEKPLPRPEAFQASVGPEAGHARSSPVSVETPSRLGPRHWGQPTVAGDAARVSPATAAAARAGTGRDMFTSERGIVHRVGRRPQVKVRARGRVQRLEVDPRTRPAR